MKKVLFITALSMNDDQEKSRIVMLYEDSYVNKKFLV
jgi:hypothetical protein